VGPTTMQSIKLIMFIEPDTHIDVKQFNTVSQLETHRTLASDVCPKMYQS